MALSALVVAGHLLVGSPGPLSAATPAPPNLSSAFGTRTVSAVTTPRALPTPTPVGTRIGSFMENSLTVKVSGSRGGIQTGPFTRLSFDDADRGKRLTVRLGRVTSVDGADLPAVPIHLYRSMVGPIRAGSEVVAFSEPPVRQVVEVAADRTNGVLAWTVESGEYFVFFPRTRPIVQIPPGVQPAAVAYTIRVE